MSRFAFNSTINTNFSTSNINTNSNSQQVSNIVSHRSNNNIFHLTSAAIVNNSTSTNTNSTSTNTNSTSINTNSTSTNTNSTSTNTNSTSNYTSSPTVTNLNPTSRNCFVIHHWNCFTVSNKIEQIEMYLNEFKPDVFSLNELKLNEQEANYMLRFSNYVTYFKCRKKGGGGVALLIREGLDARRIGDFDNFNVEIVSAVIKLDEIKVLVMSYYNPPDQSLNEGLFYEIEEKFRHYIICGDLNAKMRLLGAKAITPMEP